MYIIWRDFSNVIRINTEMYHAVHLLIFFVVLHIASVVYWWINAHFEFNVKQYREKFTLYVYFTARIWFIHIDIEEYWYRNLLVPLLAISHINRVYCLYLVTADSFAEHHFVFTEMTKQIFWFELSFHKARCQTGIGRKKISETPPPRQKEWISIQKQDIEGRACVSFWKLVEQWTCSIWHWPQEQSIFIVFICFMRFKSFQGT